MYLPNSRQKVIVKTVQRMTGTFILRYKQGRMLTKYKFLDVIHNVTTATEMKVLPNSLNRHNAFYTRLKNTAFIRKTSSLPMFYPRGHVSKETNVFRK